MGFKQVKEFVYLGIKMALRRMVASDFYFIIEKALRFLNTWGTKSLSLAGNIILIKTVILAIPNYFSSHSLVPVQNGGCGLFSSTTRVAPLRARLSWRFLNNKESLLHRTLAPKYGTRFGNSGIKKFSSSWKILCNGGKVLDPFIIWKVANGNSINVYKDKWILDRRINEWPTFVIPQGDREIFLNRFIEDGIWNEDNLKQNFGKDMVDLILKIKIDPNQDEDVRELIYQGPGRSIPGMISGFQQQDEDWEPYYWIKKAKVIPRVQTFIWRLLKNALPTFQFLAHRRLQENEICPRCSFGIEDMEHIFGGYIKIKEVITNMNKWGFGLPEFNNFQGCYRWIHNIIKNEGMILNLFFNVVYCSWKARNKLVHEDINESVTSIAVQAISQSSYSNLIYNQISESWDVNQSSRLLNAWHPPPPEQELEVLSEIEKGDSYWLLGIPVSIGTYTNWNLWLSKL
ncbi:uncharacterized protein LOC110092181 [Dendrobium catenatum]|uniref:uncharacterized protein LOC110092181 n=1 Tax=Dendrobium catenatum TaxID=906689 RepID=UPI0009F6C662|nr:uncharacterized protein LOC110092181 [Dendrobium catenatum]